MPQPQAPHSRPARRALGTLLAAACLGAAPAAHADFSVSASLGPFVFTTFDLNGDPLPNGGFSFDGSGNTSAYLLASGATTTLPSANLFANYTSDSALWAGTGPQLLPAGVQAQIAGGTAALGYSASVSEQGLQLAVSGSGANQAAMAHARVGSAFQGNGLLTLAPFVTLRLDVDLHYELHQDGRCDGDVCDAAMVNAVASSFDGPPGSFTGGGPSVGFGIGPRAVVNAGYASFLTDAQSTSASGTLTLTSFFVNDTDQPKTMDFHVSLTGAGSSVAAVPEPGSAALLGAGLLAVLAAARRRRT